MADTEIVKIDLETVLNQIGNLSGVEKQQLLSELIGNDTGIKVIFGNGQNHVLRADIVVQIASGDSEVVGEITKAIARRIEKGGG